MAEHEQQLGPGMALRVGIGSSSEGQAERRTFFDLEDVGSLGLAAKSESGRVRIEAEGEAGLEALAEAFAYAAERLKEELPEGQASTLTDLRELPLEQFMAARPSGVPPALWRSTIDTFSFAIGLRDGSVIEYVHAEIDGEWATLEGATYEGPLEEHPMRSMHNERGWNVRLSDIMWSVDAPGGA